MSSIALAVNRGIDNFTRIIVYNFNSIKEVHNVKWDNSNDFASKSFVVAIFKVKFKQPV